MEGKIMRSIFIAALLSVAMTTVTFAGDEFPNIQAGLTCPVGTSHELIVWPSVENATAEITEWDKDYIQITWLYDEPRLGGLVEVDCKDNLTAVYLRGYGKIRSYIQVPAGVKVTRTGHW